MSQTCGLSPVCVLKCLFSSEGLSKHFPQNEQGNIFLLFLRDFELFWLFWLGVLVFVAGDFGVASGDVRSLGVAGGDGGEAKSSLPLQFDEISVSSEEETPESLEIDTRSSKVVVDIGENDWVSLRTLFGIGSCINTRDKSNGDSAKEQKHTIKY